MSVEDCIHEDRVAIPIWATFTLAAAFKPFVDPGMHTTVQTLISIMPALCGAYLGYRHIQSMQAFKLEKMRSEHALERERIQACRCKHCSALTTSELDVMQNPVKAAKPSDDTVDLK